MVNAAREPWRGEVEVDDTWMGAVRANLCEQRPTLARGNEAFSRTKLVFLRGDVSGPSEDDDYISWLYRPGQRLSHAQQSGGLTFGELANLRLKDFKQKGKRVDTLQARHNRLVPILGSTLVSEFDEDFYRQERRKEGAENDEDLPEHRLDREVEEARALVRFQHKVGGHAGRGYSIEEVMELTERGCHQLRDWDQSGLIPRSIPPIEGSGHPSRTALYSFADYQAVPIPLNSFRNNSDSAS